MTFETGERWRISVDANLWPLPRPYLARGWEERAMWLGLVIGNHSTDDVFSLVLHRELSQLQLDLLKRSLALLRAAWRHSWAVTS